MKPILLALLVTLACGKSDKQDPSGGGGAAKTPNAGTSQAPGAAPPADHCLVGTYARMEGDKKQSFTFRPDGTATEVYEAGKDERPIKWTLKDNDIVHLSYLPQGDSVAAEFDMPYDCSNQSFAMKYRKE